MEAFLWGAEGCHPVLLFVEAEHEQGPVLGCSAAFPGDSPPHLRGRTWGRSVWTPGRVLRGPLRPGLRRPLFALAGHRRAEPTRLLLFCWEKERLAQPAFSGGSRGGHCCLLEACSVCAVSPLRDPGLRPLPRSRMRPFGKETAPARVRPGDGPSPLPHSSARGHIPSPQFSIIGPFHGFPFGAPIDSSSVNILLAWTFPCS